MDQENPEVERFWDEARLPLTFPIDPLYQHRPRLGLVIGTYAAVPYVHLQLEARRRLYPHVPALLHDDCSHCSIPLRDLCREYDCSFESNAVRLAPTLGDVSVFVGGLKWAQTLGLDILVKVSRRWIFTVDWSESLIQLALESQHPTFSNYTETFDFGFRTECVGLSVTEWADSRFWRSTCEVFQGGREIFVEAYMHQLAIGLSRGMCRQARNWINAREIPESRRGYAPWSLMGTDRCHPEQSAGYLWHDSHTPAHYAAQAQAWGLPYNEIDFTDPNQSGGFRDVS